MIKIFIGYDPRETVAYHVLCHSILARAKRPVSITPLSLQNLCHVTTRPMDPLQSTDFAFSRFLVPSLCDYEGWAIFMDCDMLLLDDISKLWSLRDDRYAVQVVKHVHAPTEKTKFLGQKQTRYAKKNWSSVMLFNNAECKALTPHYVNHAPGLDLHQFLWLADDDLIGELPRRWNHLVGYYDETSKVSNAHYTQGGPWFKEYSDCDFSMEWWAEYHDMLSPFQVATIYEEKNDGSSKV
jgi:lipopolysaccharide biosynthesis glycosyltransferase